MSLRILQLTTLATTMLLAGCANFSATQLAEVRQYNVPPVIVEKIQEEQVLSLQEVIELTRRGVPERLIIRQIDGTGLDYTISKDDVARLRKASVTPAVIDVLILESDRFARNYVAGFGPHYVNPYDDVLYGPDPYQFTNAATTGVGFSTFRGPNTYNPYAWRR